MTVDPPSNLIPELANALSPSKPSLVHVDRVYKTTTVICEVEKGGAAVLLAADALLFHLRMGDTRYVVQMAIQTCEEMTHAVREVS